METVKWSKSDFGIKKFKKNAENLSAPGPGWARLGLGLGIAWLGPNLAWAGPGPPQARLRPGLARPGTGTGPAQLGQLF